MTSRSHRRRRAGRTPTWVPWAVLGLAALTLVVLATAGPGGFLTFFARLGRAPQGPLNLTIVHTNDTWGFVFPSG